MRDRLHEETATHRTLEEVIRWGLSQTPPCPIVDVIVQDEFTHDVVVACGEVWLVYDTTWLGAVTAVAVWNERPTAQALLDARLRAGWTPTPTATRGGPQVMGYAACLRPVRLESDASGRATPRTP